MFKQSVLVIDDDRDILQSTGLALKEKGYEVFMASNGQQGLELVKDKKPCVALIDYDMPDINGVEVLKKTNKLSEDTRTVIFTGAGSEEVAVVAMKAGADDYVTKPVKMEKLYKIVQDYIEKFKESIIWRNGEYVYPLNHEAMSRYEFLRYIYTHEGVNIRKASSHFTYDRQHFYIFDKKMKEYGILGLFDPSLAKIEKELGTGEKLAPRKRVKPAPLPPPKGKRKYSFESFFNPNDPVQVRLEMLREAATTPDPNISNICKKFGVTREVFYYTYRRFAKYGILGLLDKKKGR